MYPRKAISSLSWSVSGVGVPLTIHYSISQKEKKIFYSVLCVYVIDDGGL